MNRADTIKVLSDKEISYEEMDRIIGELGTDALTESALTTLYQFKDSGNDVLYPLLKVLGMDAFTDEGLSKIAEHRLEKN